ncbi:YqaI family protein [Jeotgalibaca porci]|uniref:YqaI family protein n=1 Tax=Jeotgalibaca porci TaxID=1868793 RepID=UPI0035A1AB90
MNNNTNLANLHAEYFEPPTDYFELEGFNGGEIYRGEEYLEFPNGDLVLLEKETIIEYVTDRYDKLLELLEGVAIRKVAGE